MPMIIRERGSISHQSIIDLRGLTFSRLLAFSPDGDFRKFFLALHEGTQYTQYTPT